MSQYLNRPDPETSAIIGAAIEVHKTLGPGFLENVYHHALILEMQLRGISIAQEVPLPITYKEFRLDCGYRCDLIAFSKVIVELKAQSGLTPADEAQAINYLKATGLERCLLINFGTPKLQVRRIILTSDRRNAAPGPMDEEVIKANNPPLVQD